MAALDYSTFTSFPVTKRFQPSTGGVNQAKQVLLPVGTARVTVQNQGATEARVSYTGADGTAITADYIAIAAGGSVDDLSFNQDRHESKQTAPELYVSSGSVSEYVAIIIEGG